MLRIIQQRGSGPDRHQAVLTFTDEGWTDRVVTVEFSFALSDQDFASIVGQIEQASGRSVQASRSVDPDLIGGFILQAGTLRVDASVRGRLDRLRHELVRR